LERKQARREEQQQAKLAAAETQPRTGTSRRIGLPIGYKKLEFVLTLARRRHVDDALVQLAASPKRAALAVRGAVANARHNAIAAGADPSRLFVERAWTGRATPLRRPWFHGRGSSSLRQSRRTHLTVIVQEAAQPLKPKTRVVLPASMRQRRERKYPRGGLSSPSLTATTEL
jgi:ribosomal protein L22